MTRVMVLGGTGMLGHKVVQAFAPRFETWVWARNPAQADWARLGVAGDHVLDSGSVDDPSSMERVLARARPDVVVNCVGVVKQVAAAADWQQSFALNGAWPHQLAALGRRHGFRLVHISTDCVFKGTRGMYEEGDVPDATDIYGRSKLVGEVAGPGCLTLRTSIIGPELGSSPKGLVGWFLGQRGEAKGYTRAVFSGLPTATLAQLLARIVEREPTLSGLWHVSAAPVSKFDLLTMVADRTGRGPALVPVAEPVIDRSLDSTRFRQATGWSPPSWPDLVDQLVQDLKAYPYRDAA